MCYLATDSEAHPVYIMIIIYCFVIQFCVNDSQNVNNVLLSCIIWVNNKYCNVLSQRSGHFLLLRLDTIRVCVCVCVSALRRIIDVLLVVHWCVYYIHRILLQHTLTILYYCIMFAARTVLYTICMIISMVARS